MTTTMARPAPIARDPRTAPRTGTGGVRVFAVGLLPLAGHGLRALADADRDLSWCGSDDTMATARAAIRRLHPHVVVVDGRRDADLTGAQALRTEFPGLRVVVLAHTAHVPDYLRAARRARVHGVVDRSAPPPILLAALRTVLAGRRFVDPRLTATAGPAGRPRSAPGTLTRRQLEVLRRIAQGDSNADIAAALFISDQTVRTHAKEILRRLDARNRAHAVTLAHQHGLLGPATA